MASPCHFKLIQQIKMPSELMLGVLQQGIASFSGRQHERLNDG